MRAKDSMSHIFISYSHKDKKYVEKLEQKLIEEGFSVWIDHRIDYGSRWTTEIENAIDTCDAYIVVMSEDAKKSEWVQREVIHAERRKKPFFPLLLSGEFWFSLGNIQFADVRKGSLPPENFYKRLEKVTLRNKIEKSAEPLPAMKSKAKQKPKLPKLPIDRKIALRVLGVLIVGLIAILSFPNLFSQIQIPTSEPTITLTETRIGNPTSTTIPPTKTPIVTDKPLPILTQTPTALPSQITDEKNIPMVLVPAGEFMMGSEYGDDNEKPAHTVYLNAFYIDQYEVTNELYRACEDDGVCKPQQNSNSFTRYDYYGNLEFDNYPVIYVNWDMAEAFCEWRGARLPTEAEWEKAARGTDGRTYPWGEEINSIYANYNSPSTDTTPVGSYELGKSFYKVYDMAGNVWEWVADWYDSEYYKKLPEEVVNNPQGPPTSEKYKVLRGGSYNFSDKYLRTFTRFSKSPSISSREVGFRCVRSVQP